MEPVFPRLEMIAGPDEGLMLPLKEGEQVLGRAAGIEIYLSDTSVSRRHATIKRSGPLMSIRDLGSRNGTLINGRKISPGTEYPLEHGARIQVGIYEFRLALRAVAPEELKKEVPAAAVSTQALAEEPSQITHNDKLEESLGPDEEGPKPGDFGGAESPLPQEQSQQEEGQPPESDTPDHPEEALKTQTPQDLIVNERELQPLPEGLDAGPKAKPFYKSPAFMIPLIVLALLAATGVALKRPLHDFLVKQGILPNPEPDQPLPETAEGELKPVEPPLLAETNPVFHEIEPLKEESKPAPDALKDVFLDIKSEPLPARIAWREQTLGITPLKTPLSLKPGEEQEITAEFDLRDIHDRYQMKHRFKAGEGGDVISHVFTAPIGVIKILKLPRNVDFYLEGFYAYDKYKSNPVRLTDITYGKPVHVPYGHYVIELREKVKVADSETFVTEIRYHREFDLDENRTNVELAIDDKDLKFFHAKILSVPSGATIYLDEKEIGKTPYEGDIPLGAHQLRLSREGYFDYKKTLDMRTNTPYESTVKLETSKVGQYINRAKELRRIGQSQQAIGELVEGLKLGASANEKYEIQWLLGELYIDLKEYSQAKTYLAQVRSSPDYKYRAGLGLAKVAYYSGNVPESLKLLVEVLVNLPEKDPVIREARSLFTQLSPLKSVIYISTDPPGATVYVNSQMASQTTPLILSDLGLGNYRLEIQKNGFKTQQVKKSLKINEFVPVILKLEPDQI